RIRRDEAVEGVGPRRRFAGRRGRRRQRSDEEKHANHAGDAALESGRNGAHPGVSFASGALSCGPQEEGARMIRAMAALAAMAMAAPALASNQVYDFSNMLNEPHPF